MQSDFLKAPRAEARKALHAGSFVGAESDAGKAAIAAFETGAAGGNAVGASAPLDATTTLRFAVSSKGQEWGLFSGALARGVGSEDYRALVNPNGTQVRLDESLFKRLSALLDPLPKLEAASHFGDRLK